MQHILAFARRLTRPPPAADVPVTVQTLSGRELQVIMGPLDSAAKLQERVEKELGAGWLEEARLTVGSEMLSSDTLMAQLAELHRGQPVAVQAVMTRSIVKANNVVRSGELRELVARINDGPWSLHALVEFAHREERFTSKYAEALQVLLDMKSGPSDIASGIGSIFWDNLCYMVWRLPEAESDDPAVQRLLRFCSLALCFWWTRVDSGRRLFTDYDYCLGDFFDLLFRALDAARRLSLGFLVSTHEIFNEPVIAAIESPACHPEMVDCWKSARTGFDDREGLAPALSYLAEVHPQEAVRLAALQALPRDTARRGASPRGGPRGGAAAAGAVAATTDASDEREVNDIAEAVGRSNREALEREGQEVSDALLRSKADRWSADGVILARLNFHTPQLQELLHSSSVLAPCRARVAEAGCEPSPSWARGALLLVPATEEQIEEAGIELKAHHILMLSGDKVLIEQVLSELPRRKRPLMQPDFYAEGRGSNEAGPSNKARTAPGPATGAGQDAADGVDASPAEAADRPCCPADRPDDVPFNVMDELVVEHTFLNFPIGKDVSEASVVVESAPACPGENPAGPNPHRWRLP